MANDFSSENYPSTEPSVLVAGDRWAWKREDLGIDYPPATFSLTYSARLESTGTEIEITASEDGTDYVVEVASATTAAYTVGVYHWQAYITRTADSERITVDSGTFEIFADRAEATTDPRSHAKKVLDAIELVIEGKASKDVTAYSIAGRSITKFTPGELIRWRNHYRAEYRAEIALERINNGGSDGSLVRIRHRA